jgi:predicted heme/steroid binding protein
MEVFTATNSGSQNAFEWEDGLPEAGHSSGLQDRSNTIADVEVYNLSGFSPQAAWMDFNTEGEAFAIDSAASDFSSQMSQTYAAGEEFSHPENYMLAAQFFQGSNATFEHSPAISTMSFDQTSHSFPTQFNALGTLQAFRDTQHESILTVSSS